MCDLAAAINPASAGNAGWDCTGGISPPSDICVWGGVTCDGNSSVTIIYLAHAMLPGTLPTSIGVLTSLVRLFLSYNQFTGILPTSIGGLQSLVSLVITSNQLTGILPTSIGMMSSLTFLNVAYNKLSGPIPTSIGELSSRIGLYFSHNKLSGSIPDSIGGMKKMFTLALDNNKLTGTLPSSIGEMSYVNQLALGDNVFVGVVPQSLCSLHLMFILNIYNSGLVCYPACLSTVNTLFTDNNQGICTSSPTGNINTCSQYDTVSLTITFTQHLQVLCRVSPLLFQLLFLLCLPVCPL